MHGQFSLWFFFETLQELMLAARGPAEHPSPTQKRTLIAPHHLLLTELLLARLLLGFDDFTRRADEIMPGVFGGAAKVVWVDALQFFRHSLDRMFDLFVRMASRNEEPQSSRGFFDSRIENRLHIDAAGKQPPRQFHSPHRVADNNRHDRRVIAQARVESLGTRKRKNSRQPAESARRVRAPPLTTAEPPVPRQHSPATGPRCRRIPGAVYFRYSTISG